MGRQIRPQPLDLLGGHIGTGRVVRVGEKDDLRPLSRQIGQRLDIDRQIPLRRHHGCCAGHPRRLVEALVTVLMEQHLVTRAGISLRDELDHLIGAVGAGDVICLDIIPAPDGRAQQGMLVIGVAMEAERRFAVSRHRLGTGARRVMAE